MTKKAKRSTKQQRLTALRTAQREIAKLEAQQEKIYRDLLEEFGALDTWLDIFEYIYNGPYPGSKLVFAEQALGGGKPHECPTLTHS